MENEKLDYGSQDGGCVIYQIKRRGSVFVDVFYIWPRLARKSAQIDGLVLDNGPQFGCTIGNDY